jgi:ferredoxin
MIVQSGVGIMQIAVDQDKCIASGACVLAAPDVFGQDDDGIVMVRQEFPSADLQETAREAVRACPAAVIWIAQDNGGPA